MNLNFQTTNVLFGEKLLLQEPGSEPIDLGFVGQVTRVDRQTIKRLGRDPPSRCTCDGKPA
jgi:acetylglutamate kinase